MQTQTLRAASNPSPNFFQKAAASRARLEKARTAYVRRVQQDVDRIAKREREYVRNLFDELSPVKITWNDQAWKEFIDKLPVKIEKKPQGADPLTPMNSIDEPDA